MDNNTAISLITGFGTSAVLLAPLRKIAFRINLLDQPDQRKQHVGAIPLVGGLGMFLGFCFTALLLDISLAQYRGLFAGAMILVTVGVLDDMWELSTKIRFIAQIAAALMMVYWGDVELTNLGALLPGIESLPLGYLSVPFTVFATVGVINALNMIDGVDGLAGSVALTALLAMAFMAYTTGDSSSATLLALLGSTVLAFLAYNWRFRLHKRPLMFMGDAGSLFLGFFITWFLIKLSQGSHPALAPVTALWFVAVPLIDTVVMMIRRIKKGRSPFSADREHFHHVLQYAGFNRREAVFIILGISIITSALGIMAQDYGVPQWIVFGAFLTLFASYYRMITRSWKLMRFLKRSICRRSKADRRTGSDRRQNQMQWIGTERREQGERRIADRRTAGRKIDPVTENNGNLLPQATRRTNAG